MQRKTSWLIPSRGEWKAMLVGALFALPWRYVFEVALSVSLGRGGPLCLLIPCLLYIPWDRPVYLLSMLLTDFNSLMAMSGIPGRLSFVLCGMLAGLIIHWRLRRQRSRHLHSGANGWLAGALVGAWIGVALVILFILAPLGSTRNIKEIAQSLTALSHWEMRGFPLALGNSTLFALLMAGLGAVLGRSLVPGRIPAEARPEPPDHASAVGSAVKPGVVGLLILCFFTMYFWEALSHLHLGIPIKVPPPAFMTTGDFGIISQEPCGPPCFQGITPGVATVRDSYLKLLRAGKPCEVSLIGGAPDSPSTEGTLERIGCYSGSAQVEIEFSSLPGPDEDRESGFLVHSITLQPPTKITVEQLIAQYGPPDSIRLTSSSSQSAMWFYYDRLQTTVLLTPQQGSSHTVAPDTTVVSVIYLPPAGYENRLLDLDDRQPWHGFGTYQSP